MLRRWRGAFIKGATLKRTVHLGQETSVHKTKYRYCPHGENVDQVFGHSTTAHYSYHLPAMFWKKTKSKTLGVIAGRGRTFTRGGATVVFEVRAVFTLVVLWASAVVVCGQVVAGRSVLTRVGRAVIDIQLGQKGIEKRTMNLIADIVSATLNRAKPTASSLQAVPGNNTRTAL